MTDWVEWHRSYEQPGSSLARRLEVVRRRVGEVLATIPGEGQRILSLCAGDGRDLLPVLRSHPARERAVTLIEKDLSLARAAEEAARALAVESVDVVEGDAGDTATVSPYLPVELLLLCGIFGNISEHDIRQVVCAARSMLTEGGVVVWTRGRFENNDLRPLIRRWFSEAGFRERSFDGEPDTFGVGVDQLQAIPSPVSFLPERLFTFIR